MKLRSLILISLTGLAALIPLSAQITQLPPVTVESLPSNVDEFTALRDRISSTPQGGAAAFIIALNMYAANAAEGQKALIVAAELSRLSRTNGAGSYRGFALGAGDMSLIQRQIQNATYIPRCYFAGTSWNDGYAASAPYTMNFTTNRFSGSEASGQVKVFVACSGASTPRPITVVRNSNGVWKAKEWSSVLVGIHAPASSAPSDEL
ncbi:MAG: hypothetical protein K1X75_12495 [Leptospirales bacterium]|nr:hypothetical protein [Leptospirales bacterium]